MAKTSTLPQFTGENVLSLETYRKSGARVRTPVWFLEENGAFYVHTGGSTGKAKRIRRNPKVRIAPSHFRGEPKADYVDAHASIETNSETVQKYYALIYKKYGFLGAFVRFVQRFSRSKAKDIIIMIRP